MDEDKGGIAANLVDTDLFEPPYDDIAKRAIAYRRKFKKAPGQAHIDDLFDHVLSNPKNKRKTLYQHVLSAMLELSKNLNADFILSRVSDFTEEQSLKAAIYESAERFERGGEDTKADVRVILDKAMRLRPQTLDTGMFLSDQASVEYLTRSLTADFYLDIGPLDQKHVGLVRKETFSFLAPPGTGKTWSCIHAGVKALQQGAKVAHASLEMQNERVMPRYLQRLFAIAKDSEKYRRTEFETDELGRVTGLPAKFFKPKLLMEQDNIERIVRRKMSALGSRLDRLVVKSFPTGSLTMNGLRAWLDGLERTHQFIPDVLILDYPKLMHLDRKQDLRIGLGLMMEELRGLGVERNFAGYYPLQSNREGSRSRILKGDQVGEDYSLIQTTDNLITYNQTEAEKELGLARLYVAKARNNADGFSILITQDYNTGQFVRSSARMPTDYERMFKKEPVE